MTLNELKSRVALGEDSRRQFRQDVTNSNIRNPILVSYVAKGLLPYRGLGSGIKRALKDWPEIEFTDDRDGCLFTATVRRKEGASLGINQGSEKSSEKIMAALRTNSGMAATGIAELLGITPRAVEKQIAKLREAGRLRRIGPDKGGHWEVVA